MTILWTPKNRLAHRTINNHESVTYEAEGLSVTYTLEHACESTMDKVMLELLDAKCDETHPYKKGETTPIQWKECKARYIKGNENGYNVAGFLGYTQRTNPWEFRAIMKKRLAFDIWGEISNQYDCSKEIAEKIHDMRGESHWWSQSWENEVQDWANGRDFIEVHSSSDYSNWGENYAERDAAREMWRLICEAEGFDLFEVAGGYDSLSMLIAIDPKTWETLREDYLDEHEIELLHYSYPDLVSDRVWQYTMDNMAYEFYRKTDVELDDGDDRYSYRKYLDFWFTTVWNAAWQKLDEADYRSDLGKMKDSIYESMDSHQWLRDEEIETMLECAGFVWDEETELYTMPTWETVSTRQESYMGDWTNKDRGLTEYLLG